MRTATIKAVGALCAAGLTVGAIAPAFAATTPSAHPIHPTTNAKGPKNMQDGLVNVNVQGLSLQIPVSVALPVSLAPNICNISVLSSGNAGSCTATSNSWALSYAIANAMMKTTPAWGEATSGTGKTGMVAPGATTAGAATNAGKTAASSTQNGLVNVNLQNLNLQAPVPVDVAANVCNISILSALTAGQCTAKSSSQALSWSLANALAQQHGHKGGPGNTQNGLVNVNLQNLKLQIPVSVAVPVDVAANVCNVAVASLGTAGKCDAKSNSDALSNAIATSMLQNAASGGKSSSATNSQNGLVNVNVQNLNLQVPVSVAVPVAVAANVCNISVLSAGQLGSCNAKSASTALTDAIAKALASQK